MSLLGHQLQWAHCNFHLDGDLLQILFLLYTQYRGRNHHPFSQANWSHVCRVAPPESQPQTRPFLRPYSKHSSASMKRLRWAFPGTWWGKAPTTKCHKIPRAKGSLSFFFFFWSLSLSHIIETYLIVALSTNTCLLASTAHLSCFNQLCSLRNPPVDGSDERHFCSALLLHDNGKDRLHAFPAHTCFEGVSLSVRRVLWRFCFRVVVLLASSLSCSQF